MTSETVILNRTNLNGITQNIVAAVRAGCGWIIGYGGDVSESLEELEGSEIKDGGSNTRKLVLNTITLATNRVSAFPSLEIDSMNEYASDGDWALNKRYKAVQKFEIEEPGIAGRWNYLLNLTFVPDASIVI